MRTLAFAALATLAATAALASSANAQAVAWSTAPSACVVTQGADLLEIVGAKVSFKAGKTGMALLTCPITDARFGVGGDQTRLGGANLYYQDSTGTDRAASVSAVITATSLTTGRPQTIGSFSSNISDVRNPINVGVNLNADGFSLDYDRFVYHMTIGLVRASTTQAVSISAIALRAPFRRPPPAV